MFRPIEELLHLRYKPKRKSYIGMSPCPAFDFFDWIIWYPDSFKTSRLMARSPRKILCLAHPTSIRILCANRWRFQDATLVIAGEDANLSDVEKIVEPLVDRCRRIFFEAKDIEHPTIRSFSMGFISYYLARSGLETVEKWMLTTDRDDWEKAGVLAAWGSIWDDLDNKLEDRKAATRFVDDSSWLHRERLGPEDYWRRLAESRFMIAPAGKGVQAPKLAEAWLVKTVPIVTSNPCFEDLAAAGYPLVILRRWEDLNVEKLEESWEFARGIDWREVRRRLTVGYFKELLDEER